MNQVSSAPEQKARPGAVLAIVLTSYLMIVLDISIVITGLPEIRDELGFSAVGLSWIQNAYMLFFGGFLLIAARAGDVLGRKRMFVAGLTLFTAASLVIGLAPTPSVLIVSRAAQGIGAAILAPSVLALISTTFPEGEARTVDKAHGRLEIRHLRVSSELSEYLAPRWPQVAQVFQIERTITRHGKTTHELVYGLTSLTA